MVVNDLGASVRATSLRSCYITVDIKPDIDTKILVLLSAEFRNWRCNIGLANIFLRRHYLEVVVYLTHTKKFKSPEDHSFWWTAENFIISVADYFAVKYMEHSQYFSTKMF